MIGQGCWGWWGGDEGIGDGVVNFGIINIHVGVIQCFNGIVIVVIKDAIRSMRRFGFR